MGRAKKKRTVGSARANKAALNKDHAMKGLSINGAAAQAPTNTAMSPARRSTEGSSEEQINTRTHAPHDQPERRPSHCQLDSRRRYAAQAQEAHTTALSVNDDDDAMMMIVHMIDDDAAAANDDAAPPCASKQHTQTLTQMKTLAGAHQRHPGRSSTAASEAGRSRSRAKSCMHSHRQSYKKCQFNDER